MMVHALIVRHGSNVMIDSVYKNLGVAQSQMAEMWKDQMIQFYGEKYRDYAIFVSEDLCVPAKGYKNYLDTTSGLVAHPNGIEIVSFVINSYHVK